MNSIIKKFRKRYLLWIIPIFILYLILGALIPFMFPKPVSQAVKDNFSISQYYGTEGTSVDRAALAETNQEALDIRLNMMNSAKERIILSTFDIRPGKSTDDLFAVMLNAANRGVKVQILVDGLYGFLHMSGQPVFAAAGLNPNVEIRFYNTPNLLMPWTFNGRMHDKYILVDDRMLVMGGRNSFDYFLGEYNSTNPSFDRDVVIYNTAHGTGKADESVLAQIESYFDGVWNSKYCKTVLDTKENKEVKDAGLNLEQHYEELIGNRPELFSEDTDYKQITVPIKKATLLSKPIHPYAKEPLVWHGLEQLMENAKERAYIHTPYIAFSDDMYEGIKRISEQVPDAKLMLNSVAVGDNFMASSDYIHNKKKVINTGISILEFQGSHSSHGKSVLIDHDLSAVGSYNFDMRSTYVDTETMLVIHGEEFNQLLEEKLRFMEDQSLLVDSDGTYIKKANVELKEVPPSKKVLFSITSVVFQLFRYLI